MPSSPPSPPRPDRGLPVRASALSEWALLPLRIFLGVTFTYAGLQKLANPAFFSKSSPTSIQAQMAGAARLSPIHSLLHAMLPHAVIIGWIIAYAELAVGIGTLIGLKTRIAAAGGAFLSLNFGRWYRDADWTQDPHRRRRWSVPQSQLVPGRQFSFVAVLHGRRHRLSLRLVTFHRCGRRIATECRRADISSRGATGGLFVGPSGRRTL